LGRTPVWRTKATNDSTNQAYTETDLISLGEKLATLELTEPERAALGDLLSDDEVAGFGRFGIDLVGGIRVGLRAKSVRGPASDPGVHGIRANTFDIGDATKPGRF
jgi:hypothetical protein